ncbi:MAG: transporter substrate-binding domain-containing protein, partial [Clostridia bacterium]|nr:transporter substrate-binding domain-containing protein [Clostridia bacterium]
MKRFIIICCLCLSLLCICSCSNKAIDPDSNTPNVDAVKQKGELVILTNPTFPPFEYIGYAGRVEGIDMDIANEIAKDMGVSLKVVSIDFDFLIDSLKSGKGQIVASAMTITEERSKQVDFTDRYIKSSQYMLVPKDANIDMNNLKDLTFSVQEGTKGEFYIVDE